MTEESSPAPSLDVLPEDIWYAQAMEQLVEVVQALSLARDLQSVMDIVRQAARRLTGADGATFVLRDNDLCFYAEEDAISPLWKGQRFPMSACISGWTMLNRQAAVIEDIYADPRIPADAYRPTFVRSLAMVPIRTRDPIGAIGNYWAARHLPSPKRVKVLQALADTTAVALENIRVYENLEQLVRQRTMELQSILDNVQTGIVFVVGDKIVHANPMVTKIFGHPSHASVLSGSMQSLLSRDGPEVALYLAARHELEQGRIFVAESRFMRPDRTEVWCNLVAKPLEANGLPNGEIWVINDITEMKQKEAKLNELKISAERANHAKDSFLATMSHEIRTPLTGMLGMLELLSLTELDEEQRETLEAAWDSGRGLLRIVGDILDWSKIEEGKLALSHRPTAVALILKDAVNAYSRVASAKSLTLRQEMGSGIGDSYIVDPLRLSQVLNNFVSNAIKFTKIGEVVVRAELVERIASGDRLRFSVRDTGIGIPQEVQGRLFQRYSQESAETARMYGGTGLGLSICKRLAEMMDGQIDLKSEVGIGSEFSLTLTLPVSGLPGEAVPNVVPEVRQRDVEPLFSGGEDAPLVLAVDDHPVNRDLLARQIRLLGLRADTAENGKEALALWRRGGYSLVITDCHMPEMDGYALVREIRKIERAETLGRTRVIAWTANALAEEADRCERAGIDDILIKPADMLKLKEALAKWLGDRQFKRAGDPIQRDVLEAIVKDPASQEKVLLDFLRYLGSDHEKLLSLFEAEDFSGIESMAHRMEGSSRMIGANEVADACRAVVKAARVEDLGMATAASGTLADAIARLKSHLAAGGGK